MRERLSLGSVGDDAALMPGGMPRANAMPGGEVMTQSGFERAAFLHGIV